MGSTSTFRSNFTFTSSQASAFVNYYLGNPQIGTSQDFGRVNTITTVGLVAPNRSKFHQSVLSSSIF